jgi:mRNA interferase RelE/StbE
LTPIYRVLFRPCAKKRFDRLDPAIQQQIAKKLEQRRRNPRVPGDALSHMRDCYRIKLRAKGIRLVYQVRDAKLILLVLAVGSREREEAYVEAAAELARIGE